MLGLTPFERKGYDLFNAFDNFDRDFFGSRMTPSARTTGFSTDIKETENGYELTSELPGFKKEDVTVELDKGYLTITAAKGLEQNEAESEEAKKEGKYIRKERYSGEYKRSFYVGDYLTQEDIKAKFKHGLLTLDFPKKETPKVAANKFIAIEG